MVDEATPEPTPIPPPEDFDQTLAEANLQLEPRERVMLGEYLGMLVAANARMNLTRIVEPGEAWQRHVLDALTLLPFIEAAQGGNLLDLGSGGGLPGLVLAITRPDLPVTLLEATLKKARFLQETAVALGLENVTVLSERAESLGTPEGGGRDGWDLVTARAVAPMPVLLELALPLVVPDGYLLAIKGQRAHEEIDASRNALRQLRASVETTHRTATGTIVVVRRDGPIPRRFPRRPGEPGRQPL
ncbi:MAG: 16S rRNA (guanine(527)-N(7))-methyltransferase RsmG [Phycisphaerales bacterium]|nr:16S rRNA (guanine(527)-N(7))-methyltransferase RsmG [Phycisphaerales bacterium]